MIKRMSCLAVTALVLTSTACVPADADVRNVYKVKQATSGRRTNIEHTSDVNIDCSLKSIPAIKIVTPPKHGRLVKARSRDFAEYKLPNPRVRCNTRKVDGLTFYYTSDPKFVGRDSVELDIAFSNGILADVKIDIDVK